jgi:hypothetical protein
MVRAFHFKCNWWGEHPREPVRQEPRPTEKSECGLWRRKRRVSKQLFNGNGGRFLPRCLFPLFEKHLPGRTHGRSIAGQLANQEMEKLWIRQITF